jgi:hypothetical protein
MRPPLGTLSLVKDAYRNSVQAEATPLFVADALLSPIADGIPVFSSDSLPSPDAFDGITKIRSVLVKHKEDPTILILQFDKPIQAEKQIKEDIVAAAEAAINVHNLYITKALEYARRRKQSTLTSSPSPPQLRSLPRKPRALHVSLREGLPSKLISFPIFIPCIRIYRASGPRGCIPRPSMSTTSMTLRLRARGGPGVCDGARFPFVPPCALWPQLQAGATTSSSPPSFLSPPFPVASYLPPHPLDPENPVARVLCECPDLHLTLPCMFPVGLPFSNKHIKFLRKNLLCLDSPCSSPRE